MKKCYSYVIELHKKKELDYKVSILKRKGLVEVPNDKFYKNNSGDQIWWKDTSDKVGEWLFSFDKKQVFNMFADYPYNLTAEQKETFDEENPYWADFFKDRVKKQR